MSLGIVTRGIVGGSGANKRGVSYMVLSVTPVGEEVGRKTLVGIDPNRVYDLPSPRMDTSKIYK